MPEERQSPQNLTTALQEAQAVVDAAKRRSADMIADAERHLREATEEGYKKGFEAGLQRAFASAIRLVVSSAEVRDSLAQQAVKFAFRIAERVIGSHLESRPEAVLEIARGAIRESISGYGISIIAHPADIPILREREMEFRKLAGHAEVVFEGDDSMSRGGCIVRNEFGEVDASLQSLLQRLAEKLGVPSDG